MPETQSVRRVQREARAQRRRRSLLVVAGCAAVLVVAAVVVWRLSAGDTKDDSVATRVDGPAEKATTARAPAATVRPSTSSSPTTRPTTTTGPSTTGPSTTGPSANGAVVALPLADQSKPPDPPVGLYRQGKLFLVGSVPDEATGAGFLRKAAGVLGPANVTNDMSRDPRVPRGPMRIIVQEEFDFPTGSSIVDPKWEGLLNIGVLALQKLPEAKLVLTGYTDNSGPADVNQSLSEERAQVVANYMIAHGIPADRVVALGRGPSDPIADNATPEGRLRNRRIEGTLEGITP